MLKHIPFYASLLGRDLGRQKATHSHVLVYGAVEAHSNGEKGCIASNALIAKETGLAIGTVKNALTQIASARWIFIEYKDAQKNVRGVIKPLLEIATPSFTSDTPSLPSDTPSLPSDTPSLPSDTPVTGELHPRHSPVTRGNNIGNSLEDNENALRYPSEAIASGGKHNHLGVEIIKAFEAINPACKRMYGNTTQRQACDDLIDAYGLEQVMRVVSILPQTNGRKFVPTVTTPAQLRDKWVSLETALKRIKEETTIKTNCIIL